MIFRFSVWILSLSYAFLFNRNCVFRSTRNDLRCTFHFDVDRELIAIYSRLFDLKFLINLFIWPSIYICPALDIYLSILVLGCHYFYFKSNSTTSMYVLLCSFFTVIYDIVFVFCLSSRVVVPPIAILYFCIVPKVSCWLILLLVLYIVFLMFQHHIREKFDRLM